MIIQGVPSGEFKDGSTRLRYYHRKKYMPEGIAWKDFDGKLDCDVLYIQKRANYIGLIKEAKRAGIPVVYDVDDGEGVRRKGDDRPIFPLVDAITTDTEFRAKAFRKITDTPVFAVPDAIDYLDFSPEPQEIRPTIKRICTFGSFRSTNSAIPYLLPLQEKYKVSYITDRKILKLRKSKFIKWDFNKFVKKLQKHDLCILAHRNDEEKAWKGEARLLTAMAVGIPTIVTDTPSFVKTMKACGLRFWASSPEEMSNIIETHEQYEWKAMQEMFMEYAWKNHHPEMSAKLLAGIFRSVYDNTDVQ